MRILQLLALTVVIPALFAACDSTPATVQTDLGGPYSIDEFTQNSGYYSWYKTGYDAYPPVETQADFDAAVARIAAVLNAGENTYSMIMVTKPNCGCQHTQREMPRVMKTLDMAGFPQENIDIYITDTRLAGIDDIKTTYNLQTSEEVPTFIILRDGTEIGRIEQSAGAESSMEKDLANIFES